MLTHPDNVRYTYEKLKQEIPEWFVEKWDHTFAKNPSVLDRCLTCKRKIIDHEIHDDCESGKYKPDSKFDPSSTADFLESYYCSNCEVIGESHDLRAQELMADLESELQSEDAGHMPTFLLTRQTLFLQNARVVFNRHASASDKALSKTVTLTIGPKSMGGYSLVTGERYIKELIPLIEKKGNKVEVIPGKLDIYPVKVTLVDSIKCN